MEETMKTELRQELLNLAENLTEEAVNSVFRMAEILIRLSDNKVDDALIPVLEPAKNFILKYVDKINGQED